MTGAIAIADRVGAERHRERDVQDPRHLDEASGSEIEQVGEVRGQGNEEGVDDEPPSAREARRRDEHNGDARATEQLDESGREAALGEGAHVAAEAAVPARTEEVVHEPEEPEPEGGEQHEAAGQREAGLVPQPGRTRDRAPGFDDEHGEHDDDPGGGREPKTAVVGALERRELRASSRPAMRRNHAVTTPTTMPTRTLTRATAAGAGSASAGTSSLGGTRRWARTRRATMVGFRTPSIMPGTAMPESLSREAEHGDDREADVRGAQLRHPFDDRLQPIAPLRVHVGEEPEHRATPRAAMCEPRSTERFA